MTFATLGGKSDGNVARGGSEWRESEHHLQERKATDHERALKKNQNRHHLAQDRRPDLLRARQSNVIEVRMTMSGECGDHLKPSAQATSARPQTKATGVGRVRPHAKPDARVLTIKTRHKKAIGGERARPRASADRATRTTGVIQATIIEDLAEQNQNAHVAEIRGPGIIRRLSMNSSKLSPPHHLSREP